MPFDERIFSFLYNLAHKSQFLDWLLVFLASYLIFLLSAVFIIYLVKEKDWRRRFYFFALSLIAVILSRGIATPLIRFFYDRPRPFVADNFTPLIDHIATHSFPSGHMAFFFPIVLTVWLINRRSGIWFIVGALLIGASRVAVGVHWPSDILGGFLIGGASFSATYYFLKLKGTSRESLKFSTAPPKSSPGI